MGKYVDEIKNPDFDASQPIPWTAAQYLIAEGNYGGRITDNNDRRLIKVYAAEIFNDDLTSIERWRPSDTQEYNYQYSFDESNLKGE